MHRASIDTETHPIKPGRQAPRVVCVQLRETVPGQVTRDVFLREPGLDRVEHLLDHTACLFVGHEIAYDVLCSIASRPRLAVKWLRAYAADRVTCTLEREKLIRIAQGTLAVFRSNKLADLVGRYKLPDPYDPDVKGGPVRTGYHALDGVPVDQWSENFRDYAFADLVVDDVWQAQERHDPRWLADQFRQARGALWLKATSAHGMRVDPDAVRVLSELIEQEHAEVRELLTYAEPERVEAYGERKGLDVEGIRSLPPASPLVRPVGSKDTKAAAQRMLVVREAQGLPYRLSPKGKELEAKGEHPNPRDYVSLDADACAETLDPVLIAYARFGSIGTLRSRALRLEMAGRLGLPVQPRFDNLKETGRTSSSQGEKPKPGKPMLAFGDQTQNLPREPGLRECYVARPGCVILSADWKAAELHALAQACIDLGLDSHLARLLNEGIDVHLWFACLMRGWTYKWASSPDRTPEERKTIKDARQGAKACMFGFPGGLGIEKFRLFAAKQYQVRLTDAQAREYKGQWLEALPEMRGYFAHITKLIDSGAPLVHFKSLRYRGQLRYTSAANSYFQGRVADMLKDAGFRLLVRIWEDGIPARSWNEAHDEILVEHPETAHEVPGIVCGIMDDVGREWCPACPAKAEPALQIHWRKGAEANYEQTPAGPVLTPWERRPIEVTPKIRKILDSDQDPIQKSWALGVEVERLATL